jgi:hypothetical protein
MTAYVVTVDADGRLPLPDDVAARWHDRTVLLADLGDRLVIRELTAPLRGKYRERGPSTLDARAMEQEG